MVRVATVGWSWLWVDGFMGQGLPGNHIMMSHLGQVEVRVGGDSCQELHPGLGEVVRLVDARHPDKHRVRSPISRACHKIEI